MNARCSATKANGEACTLPATGQHGLCWAHAPENAEKRRRVASRGGKGKAAKRVSILWDEVRSVIGGVVTERLSPPQANSMVRAYTVLIALSRLDIEQAELDIARRRLELDEEERTEVRERLEELEEALQRQKGDRRYGA